MPGDMDVRDKWIKREREKERERVQGLSARLMMKIVPLKDNELEFCLLFYFGFSPNSYPTDPI